MKGGCGGQRVRLRARERASVRAAAMSSSGGRGGKDELLTPGGEKAGGNVEGKGAEVDDGKDGMMEGMVDGMRAEACACACADADADADACADADADAST